MTENVHGVGFLPIFPGGGPGFLLCLQGWSFLLYLQGVGFLPLFAGGGVSSSICRGWGFLLYSTTKLTNPGNYIHDFYAPSCYLCSVLC